MLELFHAEITCERLFVHHEHAMCAPPTYWRTLGIALEPDFIGINTLSRDPETATE